MNKNEPTCSIVVPTFNRSVALREAIDSILQQTFGDWERIVIDDGSTDGTQATVYRVVQHSGVRWRYYRQTIQGAGAARVRGIQFARGEYVAFLDSDDLWEPYQLETCINALECNSDVSWVSRRQTLARWPRKSARPPTERSGAMRFQDLIRSA